VDDNRDAADSMAMLLELMGHEVRIGYGGLDAVDLAETFRPDLLLLDLGMPELNGFEVARRIRAHPWGSQIAIVAMTGWGQEEDRRRSREAGFDHHLIKPADAGQLHTLLASLTSDSGLARTASSEAASD
jgi:CheY-like chemotaxis protein